jgi:predicted SnoaL-like aldol condensation-catalyzing enzyme
LAEYLQQGHKQMHMPSHKNIAREFLLMVTTGQVREAYEKYVSQDFRHHNAYFKGDRETLLVRMEENEMLFPDKLLEIKHQLEDGDLVATHSRLRINPDKPEMAVVHIVRFAVDKIVEMWDIGQEIPRDSPNENGLF